MKSTMTGKTKEALKNVPVFITEMVLFEDETAFSGTKFFLSTKLFGVMSGSGLLHKIHVYV